MNYAKAKAKMTMIGQEHVLKYYDELSEAQKEALLQQIEETDFSVLKRIDSGASDERGVFSPLAAMQLSEIEARKEELYQAGAGSRRTPRPRRTGYSCREWFGWAARRSPHR